MHGLASSMAPNGSRLSCGRSARWRKAVDRQTSRLAGESTQFFPTCERPAASSACRPHAPHLGPGSAQEVDTKCLRSLFVWQYPAVSPTEPTTADLIN